MPVGWLLEWGSLALAAGATLLLIYEIAAALRNQPADDPLTITQLVKRKAQRAPAVPFFFGLLYGLLMGHFFL